MHHFKPSMTAPIVHPTKCCVKNLYSVTDVPHIHPTHTTYVNNQIFQHKHYYPHTQSMVDSASHQHFHCGPGAPAGYGAPGAPGQVMGAMDPGAMYGAPGHVMGVNQPYGRKKG